VVRVDLRGWLLRESLTAGEASGSRGRRARVAGLDRTEVTSALIRFGEEASRIALPARASGDGSVHSLHVRFSPGPELLRQYSPG
jgi:hypothetical protein